MKRLKKIPTIVMLLIIMVLIASRFRWTINAYDAVRTLQRCNFTAECHVQKYDPYLGSVLQTAGIKGNTGYIKGQFCSGTLYAEVYQHKDEENLITKIFADQSDCLVNVSPIAEHILGIMEKKTGLSFSALKKFDGDQYVSLRQWSKLFSGSDNIVQIPEIEVKKIITQLKKCNTPEKTYYTSNGYCFYEYSRSGILIGIKKAAAKHYAIYLFIPGKAEAVIQYSYADSPENIKFPEPFISDSVLEILKLILQKTERKKICC